MPWSPLLRWSALAVVLAGAAALRTCDLSRRPMHADEANQAVKTGELLHAGGYAFDPRDHHGPTLYYFGALAARLRGERTLPELRESTVRMVPAAFGGICVILVAWFVTLATRAACACRSDTGGADVSPPMRPGAAAVPGDSGLKPALWSDDGGGAERRRARRPAVDEPSVPAEPILAAAFLAVCPGAVYYSRYYIHETLLLAFVWLTVCAVLQGRQSRHLGWACAAGVAMGCALATKETALLYLGAAWLAGSVASRSGCGILPQKGRPAAGRRRHAMLIAALALVTAAAFYSSFGRNVAGLRDALAAPMLGLRRATGSTGHEKPWWYYLALLTWQRNGGLGWHQALLVFLALTGAVAGWRCWHVRWAAVYGAILLLVLSAVPYKTPWNVIHVLPALAVLAAAGVIAMARLRTGRVVAGAFTFLGLATLLAQTSRAAFRYAADARNPYAYVHSSPDVRKFRPLVAAALAAHPTGPVRIIASEYWPLPWYLRGLPRIGYWNAPPAECDGALVIVGAEWANEVQARMHERYRKRFLGLRPGFTMVVFVPEHSP